MFHLKPVLVSLCLLVVCLQVHAASSSNSGGGQGRNFLDRADKREAKRWTLQEWLEQRDRNRMMDLWLSLNSPSPYEFMLGVSHVGYSLEQPGVAAAPHTSYAGVMSAYAQIVGVSVEYENNADEKYNDLNGLLNLRLFGESIQSSYLAVHYGLRTRTYADPGARVAQHFSQVSLQMYAIKAFGFEGLYRLYYPAEANLPGATPVTTSATLAEAGAFIDFKNFRLFGDWYKEQKTDRTSTGAESSSTQTGIKSGIKIFF